MPKMGRGACCCEQITAALGEVQILNQFEGLVIHPLCDNVSGDVVGYFSVVRLETDPPTYDTQYFDLTGNPIAIQPVNSQPCLPITDDYEYIPLCEYVAPNYISFLRQFVTDFEGVISINNFMLDGSTPYVVSNESNVTVCENIFTWDRTLSDNVGELDSLEFLTFEGTTQDVLKYRFSPSGLVIVDTHSPVPAIDWAHATIYDPTNNFYYMYDQVAGDWYRYDASNLAAGGVNLGPFGGDPIVSNPTYGAFDHVSGLGYFGRLGERYEIDFIGLTVTAVPPLTLDGIVLVDTPSSLSITESGQHYCTSIFTNGSNTRFHVVDKVTGISPQIGSTVFGVGITGADYDFSSLTGFYGIGLPGFGNSSSLYRWVNPDGSDIILLGAVVSSGTLAISAVLEEISSTLFQRIYHKNLSTGMVDHQNHDSDGQPYLVQGQAEFVSDCCFGDQTQVETQVVVINQTFVGVLGGVIPNNTLSYSILIIGGTADIDGITRPNGYSINQFPQSHGDNRITYPSVNITNIVGEAHVVYATV